MGTYPHVCAHVYPQTKKRHIVGTYAHVYECVFLHKYIYISIYIYIYIIHTHTHIYIYTHTEKQTHVSTCQHIPSFSQSSFEIRLRMSSASSANISLSPTISGFCPSASSSSFAGGYLTLKFKPALRISGCGAPQPRSGVFSSLAFWTSCLQVRFVLHTIAIFRRRS